MEDQLISEVLHDRYCIKSLLGRQTGRRTYLAIDLQTGQPVVVKLLLFGADFNWDDLKLFEREAAVLKSLEHSAIPQYRDYFDVETALGKGFGLVQTYLEAKSLQDLIQSGRTFSEPELKQIAQALLSVLEYIHGRQPAVVHRDLKPSNILLGDRSAHSPGKIYLVDFGSVQAGRHDGTRTVVGTYGYMPPEQFGGITSPATDLYALGATLIYMATGQHPADLPQRDQRMRFDDRVSLTPPLVNWLKWMTEPSLEKRPKSANQSLKSLTAGRSESTTLTPVTQPFGSKVRLKNTGEVLEIVIPPRGLYDGFFSAIVWICFVAVATTFVGFSADPARWSVMLILLPFILLGISMGYGILFGLIGQVRFRIVGSAISHSREIAGWRLYDDTADRQHLSKIELTTLSYREDPDGDKFAVPPQLNIWVGTKLFRLGEEGGLTPPELEWLAQEVATWLNMPISR